MPMPEKLRLRRVRIGIGWKMIMAALAVVVISGVYVWA